LNNIALKNYRFKVDALKTIDLFCSNKNYLKIFLRSISPTFYVQLFWTNINIVATSVTLILCLVLSMSLVLSLCLSCYQVPVKWCSERSSNIDETSGNKWQSDILSQKSLHLFTVTLLRADLEQIIKYFMQIVPFFQNLVCLINNRKTFLNFAYTFNEVHGKSKVKSEKKVLKSERWTIF